MIAVTVILVILALILLMPVGAEASYDGGVLSAAARLGPIHLALFPRKKRRDKAPKEKKTSRADKKSRKSRGVKAPMTAKDILGIARLGLKTLNRFRKKLCLDELTLHICIGASEPFDAVKQYGYLNAALGTLYPMLHLSFKIRREDIATALSFENEKTTLDVKLAASLRLWEVLYIAACAGVGFLRWRRERKRCAALNSAQAAAADNGEEGKNTCS